MRIEIDPTSPTPPSEQIANQIRFAVSAGRLRPGDRLPSVRGLAGSARINPNTVARSYRALEREGTVVSRPGAGMFVAPDAPDVCEGLRDRLLRSRLDRLVADALASGLGPDRIERLVAEALLDAAVEAA